MKRTREIHDDWTEEDRIYLLKLGIKVKVGVCSFFIDEDDERYYEIRRHFEERWKPQLKFHDIFLYTYTDEDYDNSEYFLLNGWNPCGYPQPSSDFRYKSISFDAEKICSKCGCGRVQTNDLRVNKLSKHGFWSFTSWIIDEFFVSENVYEEVFAPHGIEKRSVIKGGKVVEGVYQLVIPVIDEPLDLSDRDHWPCPVCREIKYTNWHFKYAFFPLHKHPLPGIYKTKEYFGAGHDSHQAQHQIIISKDVADKLLKSKDVKKWFLIPCRRKED